MRTSGRAADALGHFFSQPYNPTLHRDRFALLVTEAMVGHGLYARSIAQCLNEILADPPLPLAPGRQWRVRSYRERDWLAAFLCDAPDWDERLRAWIVCAGEIEHPVDTE